MRKLAIALCVAILASSVHADTIDDAEAKKQGVAVHDLQMEKAQARIVELEKENADLKQQLAEAKRGPAASGANGTRLTRVAAELTPQLLRSIESYRAEQIEDGQALLAKIASDIAREQAAHSGNSPLDLSRQHEAQANIAKYLAGLRDKSITPVPLLSAVEVARFGMVPYVKVQRVLDKQTAVVSLLSRPYDPEMESRPPVVTVSDSYRGSSVVQAEANVAQGDALQPTTALLTGVDTIKWADDHVYRVSVPVVITETRNVDGETMPVAEFVQMP